MRHIPVIKFKKGFNMFLVFGNKLMSLFCVQYKVRTIGRMIYDMTNKRDLSECRIFTDVKKSITKHKSTRERARNSEKGIP